jgi:hypothetical protein
MKLLAETVILEHPCGRSMRAFLCEEDSTSILSITVEEKELEPDGFLQAETRSLFKTRWPVSFNHHSTGSKGYRYYIFYV